MSEEGSSDRLGELVARVDELTRELRRQGRAAVAAQAAAESCLEAVSALGRGQAVGAAESEAAEEEAGARASLAWLRALLPIADAVDRVVKQAEALAERRRAPAPRLWPFGRAQKDPADEELVAMREGLRGLRAQLEAALSALGVTVDRREGIPVDPERHRVVETREVDARGERVLEVLRPGYALGGRLVREAEVAASRARAKERRSAG